MDYRMELFRAFIQYLILQIYETVFVACSRGPRMQIGNASVAFKARGMGANGLQEYSFQLDLYQPVDDEESDFRVTDTSVNIVLVKRNSAVWPRLTESKDRLPWLRTDFDRLSEDVLKAMFAGDGDDAWESDADADDSSPKTSVNFVRPSAEELRKRNMQRVEEIAREQYNEFLNLIKNPLVFYLLIFNIFQWAGYLYVFGVLVTTWWSEGEAMKSRAFDLVADRLIVVQVAAFLEIAHVLLGWVKGGILPKIMQVCGRNIVLFAVLLPHKELQEDSAVLTLFIAWSLIEVVRYPYYALRLFDEEIGLISYLRYTLWIPLYPLGFMCEGKLIILSMPLLEMSRKFCLDMPNWANVSFDFPIFLHVYVLLMLPGFFILMQHMYLQRRRKMMSTVGTRAGRFKPSPR
uniref:Very-long-chain (3R)-3-hydroxyacyl-CoA dehydratase n=1 Tax=Mesocestoides corti TaxID=53468 RepID=A0A5K3FMZ6_MESCO